MNERIGIYGGTFAPVHYGHLRAAESFLQVCSLDRLYIVPTGISPHKVMAGGDTPEERLCMLELAFADLTSRDRRIVISDWEQRQTGKSYTVNTLEHFRAESETLFLLCGTDMFLTLEKWYRGADILRMASVMCAMRVKDEGTARKVREKAEEYRARYGTEVFLPETEICEISSTEIRNRFFRGEDISEWVPENVIAYMREHKLYQYGENNDNRRTD